MAIIMRGRVSQLISEWRQRGYDLEFAAGIALGYATIGAFGFGGRMDYAATGLVTDTAVGLFEAARPNQILATRRVTGELRGAYELKPLGDLPLRGFSRPVPASEVIGPLVMAADGASLTAMLTSRELEVAALIAEGLSNRELAARLTITEGTAANHVANILRKLSFESRAQIAVWAVQHELTSGRAEAPAR